MVIENTVLVNLAIRNRYQIQSSINAKLIKTNLIKTEIRELNAIKQKNKLPNFKQTFAELIAERFAV